MRNLVFRRRTDRENGRVMKFLPLAAAALLALLASTAEAVVRRCFACRSRGELGDCRDPFYLSANSTLIESKQAGVESPPCASGWCSKIIEGHDKSFKDADYGLATQRDCLQRPPSDGKERCAEVVWNRKQVFMCFCKGDLCNSAGSPAYSWILTAVSAVMVLFLAQRRS